MGDHPPTAEIPTATVGTAVSDLLVSPWSVCNQTLPDRDAEAVLCRTDDTKQDVFTDTAGAMFRVHKTILGRANLLAMGFILHHPTAASGKTATFRFYGERQAGLGPGPQPGATFVEHFGQHLFDLAVTAGAILLPTASRYNLQTNVNGTPTTSGQAAYGTTLTVSNSTVISPGVREVGYGFPMLVFDKLAYRRIWCAGKIGTCDMFRLVTGEV